VNAGAQRREPVFGATLHQRKAGRPGLRHEDEIAMLTLDECIGMSGLTEDEIAVIAEHQRVPQIVAVEMGHTLLATPKGIYRLRGFIVDLLERAEEAGRRERAKHLDRVLKLFNARHPTPRVLRM
jgi:hypothetical protein